MVTQLSLVVLAGVTVRVVVFVTAMVVSADRPAMLLPITTAVREFTGTVGTTTVTPSRNWSAVRPFATRTPPIVMLPTIVWNGGT